MAGSLSISTTPAFRERAISLKPSVGPATYGRRSSSISFSFDGQGPTPEPGFELMPGELPAPPPKPGTTYNSRGDVEEDAAMYHISAHQGAVYAVCFSADNEWLFSASQDNTVRVWRMADGECMHVIQSHDAPVLTLATSCSVAGKLLVTGDKKNKLILFELRGDAAALRPTKRWEADDSGGSGWDIPYQAHPSTRYGASYTTKGVNALALTPDDRLVCSGTARGTVSIFQSSSGKPYTVLLGHTGPISCIKVTADSRYVFSSSADATIMIWDIDELGGKYVNLRKGTEKLVKRRIVATLRGHSGGISSMVLSSDDRRLYSSSSDGTTRAWMVVRSADGKHIRADPEDESLYLHGGSASSSGTATTAGAHCLRVMRGHCGQSVRALALSESEGMAYGTLFSAGEDNAVKVWRAADGRWLRTLKGHTDWATTLALSPDNTMLASGSHDATLMVFRVGGIVKREVVAAATTVSAAQLIGGGMVGGVG